MLRFLSLLLVGFVGVVHAQSMSASDWARYYQNAGGGAQNWQQPTRLVQEVSGVSRVYSPWAGGAMQVARTGGVVLADARTVAVTARSTLLGADLLAAARGFAGGPWGLTAAMLLQFGPGFVDWFNSDGQQHYREAPDGSGVQIKDPGLCTVAPCYSYKTDYWWDGIARPSKAAACSAAFALRWPYYASVGYTGGYSVLTGSTCAFWGMTPAPGSVLAQAGGSGVSIAGSIAPATDPWIPASMDDIAPYMQNLPFASSVPEAILGLGPDISLPVTPYAITTGTVPELQPTVRTTDYPAPSPTTSTETLGGNPYGLAPDTATEIGRAVGHTLGVLPGASTVTGTPLVAGVPAPGPISSPNTTVSTATYSPTTAQTTVQHTTTTNPQTVVETMTPHTNITNTPTTSTVTTNTTTSSVVTDNTTNVTTTTNSSSTTNPNIVTCGLPNTPACKIDETGTPAYDPKSMKLDIATLDVSSKSQRDTISGASDKSGMFSSWGNFFTLPPLTACSPVVMPTYAGVALGNMDICPGAEWLRSLMGFIWAAAGFLFVFRTVSGVI